MKKSTGILIVCLSILLVLSVIGYSVYHQYYGVEIEISENRCFDLTGEIEALPGADAGSVVLIRSEGKYGIYNDTAMSDLCEGLYDAAGGEKAVSFAAGVAAEVLKTGKYDGMTGTKVVGKARQTVFMKLSADALKLMEPVGKYTGGTLIIKFADGVAASYTLDAENAETGDSFTCNVGEINYMIKLSGEDVRYVYEDDISGTESE